MSNQRHTKLRQEAVDAIANVFSDTTVAPSVALESLEGLRDEIDSYIEAITADIARLNGHG